MMSMAVITKKQLIWLLIIEVAFLICLGINNFYLKESISRGNFGVFDWLYMYLFFPAKYLTGSWLLSSPIFLMVKSFSRELMGKWKTRIIFIALMSLAAVIISKFIITMASDLINIMVVIGIVMSGMTMDFNKIDLPNH